MNTPDRPAPVLVDDVYADAFRDGCEAERTLDATSTRSPAERAHRVAALEEVIAGLEAMRQRFEGRPHMIEELVVMIQKAEGRLHIARREEESDA